MRSSSNARQTSQEPSGDLLVVQATVTRVRCQRDAWAVASVAPSSPLPPPLGDGVHVVDDLAVVGTWPAGCSRGLVYTLTGRPEPSKYGYQLKLDPDTPPALVEPSDRDGLIRLLAAEDVTHLGPVRAAAVVDRFGVEETLRILAETPERLAEISGITPARAAECGAAWQRVQAAQNPETRRALYKLGLTRWQIGRLLAEYGAEALDIVRKDPYRIVELDGFGFHRADAIALRGRDEAGRPTTTRDDPRRVRAGVLHVLQALAEEGHTEAPAETVCALVTQKRVGRTDGLGIDVPVEAAEAAVAGLLRDGKLRAGSAGRVALRALREAEETTARGILALHDSSPGWDVLNSIIDDKYGLTFEQKRAVGLISGGSANICSVENVDINRTTIHDIPACFGVVTGGPGTGKTHCLKAALDLLDAAREPYLLAAPTGKAARRMMQATGRRASTLHILLGYRPGEGFSEEPLPDGTVVVDEASMMDAELAAALVSATRPGQHRIVLVGDVDQLPSVGPGAVLRDVIASRAVPVVRLSRVMRQAAGSDIITGAHAVNAGRRPAFLPWPARESDLRFLPFDDEAPGEDVARQLVRLVCDLMPTRGIDPLRDVQVLCPMKRFSCGTEALGAALAARLNPPTRGGDPLVLFEARKGLEETPVAVRAGDRVIQIRNDYQLGIFNGETGFVLEVVPGTGCTVDFADSGEPPRPVVYSLAQARKGLRLAYALTVHKFQGSESKVIVIPVVPEHTYMWGRQLLYTGITRARSLCVLLGTEKALGRALAKTEAASRWTALQGLLEDGRQAA